MFTDPSVSQPLANSERTVQAAGTGRLFSDCADVALLCLSPRMGDMRIFVHSADLNFQYYVTSYGTSEAARSVRMEFLPISRVLEEKQRIAKWASIFFYSLPYALLG